MAPTKEAERPSKIKEITESEEEEPSKSKKSSSKDKKSKKSKKKRSSKSNSLVPSDQLSGLTDGVIGGGQQQQQQQQGGGGKGGQQPLSLRLDLNLDVEITLKARVHGDVTLALLA
ncbi:uncharacterized protein B0P05DRAFT_540492 [Gilbertella persicaria]|uniref:uncharacterized protein n=1 Tax=Gilbertella persicaria TaxID=101096 RepID=UPI00221E7052|nr:uncharacterized protein B0P05DRAFT_540492 [Gilbertella persicaria]KAI8080233.1 hypothetical protein B0P05DRAFT_540492 [Gilbertella persicaria]